MYTTSNDNQSDPTSDKAMREAIASSMDPKVSETPFTVIFPDGVTRKFRTYVEAMIAYSRVKDAKMFAE